MEGLYLGEILDMEDFGSFIMKFDIGNGEWEKKIRNNENYKMFKVRNGIILLYSYIYLFFIMVSI